jgi:hypothetical protein
MLFHSQKFRMPAFHVDHNARAVALGYLDRQPEASIFVTELLTPICIRL